MSDTILETPRLIIRQWRDSDIEPMTAISQDPVVMEYFAELRTPIETRNFIAANKDLCNKLGYCFYAVALKETEEFIGFVGISPVDAAMPFAPAVEIGWRIATKFWDKGYATEAAKAIMDQAFNHLGIDELVSFTVPTNIRSIKVMERLGFTRSETENFDHPKVTTGHPLQRHVLYRQHKILINDAPLLRRVAKEVVNFGSNDLNQFITKMFQIMQQKNGAGLAAPQIGVSQRLFVYGFDFNPRYPDAPSVPRNYVINPEILWESDETVDLEEGCLAVPNVRGMVSRARHIRFATFDCEGKRLEKKASDFEARIILHEIDHINGILFIDRAINLRNTVKA